VDEYPSFVTELKHQHVDPKLSVKVLVACIASLCVGASMGLEAGLGSTGAAAGHVLAEQVSTHLVPSQDADVREWRRRLYILCGICAAFGSILPAPFAAVLLVAEMTAAGTESEAATFDMLGGKSLSTKVLAFLTASSSAAFVMRYALMPAKLTTRAGYLMEYDNMSAIFAVGLSFVAVLFGLLFLLLGAPIKLLFKSLGGFTERSFGKGARQIINASLGGAITGVALYLFPLTFSSGKSMMMPTIRAAPFLSGMTLLGTAVAKIIAYWAGAHSGLVGGLFFPALYVGLLAGELSSKMFNIEPLLAITVLLGAVPGSFVPCPFTMLAFPITMFVMGPLHSVSIFIGVMMSSSLMVGTGLLGKLAGK